MSAQVHRLETGYQPEPDESSSKMDEFRAGIQAEVELENAEVMALAAKTIGHQHEIIKTLKGIFATIERHDFPNMYREAPALSQRLKQAARL